MPDTATRGDLQKTADDIKDYVRERSAAIEHRLDRLNGTVVRHEVRIAEEGQKVKALEKEVYYGGPRRRTSDRQGDAEAWAMSISKREGALIALGLVIVTILVQIIGWLTSGIAGKIVSAFKA